MTISGPSPDVPPPSVGGIREPEPTRAAGSEVKTESLKSQVAEGFVKALATTTFEILAAFISRPMAAKLSRTAMLAPFMGQRIKPGAVFDQIVQERQVRKVQERVTSREKVLYEGLDRSGTVAEQGAQVRRGLITQLDNVKSVLTECAEHTKKPRLDRDGTLRAVDRSSAYPEADVASSTGTISALQSMLRTLHSSMLQGIDPPKGKAGAAGKYADLVEQFASLPQTQALARRDPAFAKTLSAVTIVAEQVDKSPASGIAPIQTKEQILQGILSGNDEISLLMRTSHRNNAETANLFGDLLTTLKSTDPVDQAQLGHAIRFAQTYLARGDSVPVGGRARAELHAQLSELAEMGGNQEFTDQVRSLAVRTERRPAPNVGIESEEKPVPNVGIEAPSLQLISYDAQEFSSHACALMETAFLAIRPSEFDDLAWSKQDVKEERAPNLLNYVQVFNKIAAFAEHQIVFADDPKKAAVKVLEAADLAAKQGNYGAAFALYSALGKTSVGRMKRTIFEKFSADERKKFNDLKSLLSSNNNMALRGATTTRMAANNPVVPAIGMYMTDLTFMMDGMGNTGTISENQSGVNLRKNRAFADVKDKVKTLQETVRNAAGRPVMDPAFAEGLAEFSTTESEVYQQSLIVEPRQAQ